MFEAVELGNKISKAEFAEAEPGLRLSLLRAQRMLREADFPVIVVIAGVEGAGKTEVVARLNAWLDPRGVRTNAFWETTEEETLRPRFWRYWQGLPPKGTVGIMFGSWYTMPIIARVAAKVGPGELASQVKQVRELRQILGPGGERVAGGLSKEGFERQLRRIERFERMLCDDGALILKFWYHLSKSDQARAIKRGKDKTKRDRVSPLTRPFAKHYELFAKVCAKAIRLTDTVTSPWHLVESSDRRYRDLTTGRILLQALQARLEGRPPAPAPRVFARPRSKGTVLDQVDLSQTADGAGYSKRLAAIQNELHDLAWKAHRKRVPTVAVFEGWDASGKGGAIRRVTAAIDPRLFRVIPVAAPSDEERAHHYLWRFWRHIPAAGALTIFDRSWYGRVLVERVEGFASELEWRRSYKEINDFEEQLGEHGIMLCKFWIHISKEEQLARFEARKASPLKQHKITAEDWRNRERWEAYAEAVNEMVLRTSSSHAPWTLVPGVDKRHARLQVLTTLRRALKAGLKARA